MATIDWTSEPKKNMFFNKIVGSNYPEKNWKKCPQTQLVSLQTL